MSNAAFTYDITVAHVQVTTDLMQKLGVAATNRASFYLYTVREEIDQLVEGLHTVRKVFA